MRHLMIFMSSVLFFILTAASVVQATESNQYPDGHGGTVTLPHGDRSFADKIVEYKQGTKRVAKSASDPEAALGSPNFSNNVNDGSFLTLGCGGSVVLEFTDNELIDVDGPDLYVFEVGPKVEGMSLAISKAGKDWISVGDIGGGRSDVDISEAVQAGDSFRFVKLIDDGQDCGTKFSGADIDSVAAIGSAVRFVLDGEVLFAQDSAELRDDSKSALDALAGKIVEAGLKSFRVVGYTDSQGSEDYNLALSKERAAAVRQYLAESDSLASVTITAEGRGEASPIASNDTESGRQQNRRVEIVGK